VEIVREEPGEILNLTERPPFFPRGVPDERSRTELTDADQAGEGFPSHGTLDPVSVRIMPFLCGAKQITSGIHSSFSFRTSGSFSSIPECWKGVCADFTGTRWRPGFNQKQ
jgi:hypothetical protein